MKYVILLAVVVAVLWLARSARRRVGGSAPTQPPPAREEMVACPQCGMHLPRGEALPGRGGLFCSEHHRAEYERANPHAG
ncbi:MAG: hypothetical protein KA151_02790 [Piscinibacter sp.]|nr:hypothetical protein [Piscinibacter sp.]